MADLDNTLASTLANAQNAPSPPPPLSADDPTATSRQPKFNEEWDASARGSSILDSPGASAMQHPYQYQQQQRQPYQNSNLQRASSVGSRSEYTTDDNSSTHGISLSRSNTLKKKNSLRRSGSLGRSGSRRSMRAGSVQSLAVRSQLEPDAMRSPFYCPVPTSGSPTDALAQRFQSWRRVLKDLIAYFREMQNHFEHRSKSLLKVANVGNNITTPAGFLASGGLDDALKIFRGYHKTAILEANKAKEIGDDVISGLSGLRSDLNRKIKEIKNLSSDFKNSVEKEMNATKTAVKSLSAILGESEADPSMTTGKQDPYILRLAVDRQVERQLNEENYLHQAYLNLEVSGRELEAIVVGEIQKAYNAYAGILKREADTSHNTVRDLRSGPIAMPKDREWVDFIQRDPHFIDPAVPTRTIEQIHYPGQDHYACQEIRAGLLERKTKYLKSYTAGWYVLSPTHLHEFKSADRTGTPIMSLYLPEQKLGSHSTEGGSSNKFLLKGRQTGAVHRGHTWVFRAESHETMMAWYEDIKALTEKSPEEIGKFVRGHSRAYSRASQRSTSSDGMVDEEDDVPFSADPAVSAQSPRPDSFHIKQHTGGRFPSVIQPNMARGFSSPESASSEPDSVGQGLPMNGDEPENNVIAAAAVLPGSGIGNHRPHNGYPPVGQLYGNTSSVRMDQGMSHAAIIDHAAREDGVNPYSGEPIGLRRFNSGRSSNAPIAISGPVPASMPRSSGRSTTSDDSGFRSSSGAQRSQYTDGYATPKDEYLQLYSTNGSLKQSPGVLKNGNLEMQNGDQVRPGGQRNSSVPYVPGGYL